jgi:hypothetical protein
MDFQVFKASLKGPRNFLFHSFNIFQITTLQRWRPYQLLLGIRVVAMQEEGVYDYKKTT